MVLLSEHLHSGAACEAGEVAMGSMAMTQEPIDWRYLLLKTPKVSPAGLEMSSRDRNWKCFVSPSSEFKYREQLFVKELVSLHVIFPYLSQLYSFI